MKKAAQVKSWSKSNRFKSTPVICRSRTRTNASATSAIFSRRTTCSSHLWQSPQGSQRKMRKIGLPLWRAVVLAPSRFVCQPNWPVSWLALLCASVGLVASKNSTQLDRTDFMPVPLRRFPKSWRLRKSGYPKDFRSLGDFGNLDIRKISEVLETSEIWTSERFPKSWRLRKSE